MAGEIPSLKGLGTAKTHSDEGKKSLLSPRLLSLLALPAVALSCSPKPTPDIPQITTPTTVLTEGVPTPIATESPTYKQLDAIRQKVVELASQINGISILDSANSDQLLVDQKTILQQFQDSQQADIDNFLTQNTLGAKITLASTQVISAMTDQGGSFEAGFSTLQYSNISDGKPLGSALTFQFKDFQGNVVNAALLQDTDQTIDGKTVRRFMALSGQTGEVIFPAIIAVYDNSTDASPAQVYVLIPDGNGNFKVMPLKGDADSQNIQAFSGQTENISFKITRPTPTVIETPSVPMIEVDGLQIPDPKASNPEFFNLTSPDSPIVQFANAFGVNPEEVGDLTPQLLTGIDGKQFVAMTTGDLTATSTFDESGTPLLIAEQGENGEWKWKNVVDSLRILADSQNLLFGSQIVYYKLNDPNYISLARGNFNFFTSAGEIYEPSLWKTNDPTQPYDYDYSRIDRLIEFAKNSGVETFHLKNLVESRIHQSHDFWPQWVFDLNKDDLLKIMVERINSTMVHMREVYPQGNLLYSVTSEAFDWNRPAGFIYEKLGIDYIKIAYESARQADPNAILIYEDVNIFHEGKIDDHDRAVISLVTGLKQQNLIDGIGLEMHVDPNNIPSPETFAQLIDIYQKLGLKVYITEFDLDFSNFQATQQEKEVLKAKVYQQLLGVVLEKNIDGFAMFGFTGAAAWHPDGVIFDQQYKPTAAFYTVASQLLSTLSQ